MDWNGRWYPLLHPRCCCLSHGWEVDIKDEEVPGKAYACVYIDGMVFGIWVGMGFGVAFSMIAWAMYHSVGR
jgi:hypothetical protein